MNPPANMGVVTGGGPAIALRAAAEGAQVAITGRNAAKGAKVLDQFQAAGANREFSQSPR